MATRHDLSGAGRNSTASSGVLAGWMPSSTAFWPGVELRHLLALETIAREGSFSAAAEVLGYTQSAISGQVAQLEAAIGVQVFRRLPGRRGVEVTAEGAALLEHIRPISARLRAARADIEAIRRGTGVQSLRVGTFPSLSTTLLPDVLMRVAAPPVPVRIDLREEACGTTVMAAVERGELDAAFTTLPMRQGPYSTTRLLHDPYCLVVSDRHAFAVGTGPVPLNRLAELPIVAQFPAGRQAEVEASLCAIGVRLNVARRADTWTSIYAAVDAGDGFGLVPSLALATLPARLKVLPLDSRMPTRTVVIAWHADRIRTPGLDRLIDASSAAAAHFSPRTFAERVAAA
jgi:DNA-binding transcriptional LysR family regulator